jgi:hypothetical protein
MRQPPRLALCLAIVTTATNVLAQDGFFPRRTSQPPETEPPPATRPALDEPPPDPPAVADPGRQPIAYAGRTLTLPAKTFSTQLDAALSRAEAGRASLSLFQTELAGSYGVTDDLTVEVRPGGFVTGDVDPDYTRFLLGATYRFLDGPVEVGARFRFQVDSNANVGLNPALVVRVHGGNAIRLDTGINFAAVIPTDGATPVAALGGAFTDYLKQAEAGIPLDIAFQVAEPMFVGFSTGYGILTFEDAGQSSFMPLGLFAGGTVPGDDGPVTDIGVSFGFPLFLLGSSGENPNTNLWTAGITVRGFLYL